MKTIILSDDTVVDGALYEQGQVVVVPDDFNTNIRRVVATSQEMRAREDSTRTRAERVRDGQRLPRPEEQNPPRER